MVDRQAVLVIDADGEGVIVGLAVRDNVYVDATDGGCVIEKLKVSVFETLGELVPLGVFVTLGVFATLGVFVTLGLAVKDKVCV